MDKVIEKAQQPERFPKTDHIVPGSDGWLSPSGEFFKANKDQHKEVADWIMGNQSSELPSTEVLRNKGWILINGPIFRTDNALNYTTNQLNKLSDANIPIVGAYDGSKEFSSQETLDWTKSATKNISDFLDGQDLLDWSGNKINQDEFWREIGDRGYPTLEDFRKDPFHTRFADFRRVRFIDVRDVLTRGYQDEIIFDHGMETYTLRLVKLDSGERICVEYTFHHHDRDSGNEEHMNIYVVDNFTFKDKIKKYISSGIKPQITGDYFKELIESK
ncbi:MAG: hypothetical protein ABSC49_03520 [Candidatus Microgenomates bacterium]|jgi:hypothetical protein